MREIELTRGMVAAVDDADFADLSASKWHAVAAGHSKFYAARKVKTDGRWVSQYMHRMIVSAPKGMDVDHLNGDSLDNRRQNLRVCTRSENLRNSRAVGCGFNYDPRTRKWFARVSHKSRRIFLGRFQSRKAAELAVSRARLQLAEE